MALLDDLVPPLLKAVHADLAVCDTVVPVEDLLGFAVLSGIAAEMLTATVHATSPTPQNLDAMRASAETSFDVAMVMVRGVKRVR